MRIALSLFVVLTAPLAAAEERVAVLPPGGEAAVVVECPVGRTTRILLPEPLKRLWGLGTLRSTLGLSVEQASPVTALKVEPRSQGAQGSLEFVGTTVRVRLELTSVAEREPVDVRVVAGAPVTEAPATEPSNSAPGSSSASAPASATPPPSATPEIEPTPTAPIDFAALLSAEPVAIDRREGLPGQPELRLVDALKGDALVWLRLRLMGGSGDAVRRVSWQDAEVPTFTQEPRGSDLWIVVQLPRALLARHAKISIETRAGLRYRVAVRRSTLGGLLSGILH